jgi:RNA polymerase-binding transcription factor DksA
MRMNKQEARKRLEQERERLQSLLSTVELTTDDGSQADALAELSVADQHPADFGTETFEREKDVSIRTQVEAELSDVDRAVKRVEDGTYGVCEACGKSIGAERLRAVPWARFCVKDQARHERETRIA